MPPSRESPWPLHSLALTWLLSTGFYAGLSTAVFHSFIAVGFDNAIMEQVVTRLSRFSAPITEVEGTGVNYFGDHFSPALALYAPFYRLVPAPETVFVVQAAVLGLSVVVILVAASRCLGRHAGLYLTLMYALSFGLVNSVVMSARETPFSVLLLALAGAAYLRRSTRGVVLASLGLLLVKEDLGLTVAAIGFVLALDDRSRRAGVALMAVGTAAAVMVVTVIIPAFSNNGISPYASTPSAMLQATWDGWGVKLVTIFVTFGVAGFLALGNRWSLVTLPTFLWRFTAPNVAYWTPLWHYSAPLMPIVFLAALPVLRDAHEMKRRTSLVIAGVLTAITLSWTVVVQVIPVIDAYGSPRPVAARRALDSIPTGATVVSDEYLIGHLAGDHNTYYMVEFQGCPRPEYVVAHVGRPQEHIWGGRVATSAFDSLAELETFAEVTYGATHEVVADEEGYVVLRRSAVVPSTPCVPAEPAFPWTS